MYQWGLCKIQKFKLDSLDAHAHSRLFCYCLYAYMHLLMCYKSARAQVNMNGKIAMINIVSMAHKHTHTQTRSYRAQLSRWKGKSILPIEADILSSCIYLIYCIWHSVYELKFSSSILNRLNFRPRPIYNHHTFNVNTLNTFVYVCNPSWVPHTKMNWKIVLRLYYSNTMCTYYVH